MATLYDVLRKITPEGNEEEMQIQAHEPHDLEGLALEQWIADMLTYAYEAGHYDGALDMSQKGTTFLNAEFKIAGHELA